MVYKELESVLQYLSYLQFQLQRAAALRTTDMVFEGLNVCFDCLLDPRTIKPHIGTVGQQVG